MNQLSIQDYLNELQILGQRLQEGTQTTDDLLAFIGRMQEQHSDEAALKDLFCAEQAFYSGDYETALKNYLKAKDIPFFHFFCYRVSAYIARKREHWDQALKFAQKAYELQSNDPATVAIRQELLTAKGETPEDPAWTQANTATASEPYTLKELTIESFPAPTVEAPSEPLEESHSQPPQRHYQTPEPAVNPSNHNTPQRDTAMNYKVDMLNSAEHALETRIQNFQRQRAHYLGQYVKQARHRAKLDDYCLYVFNGWDNQPTRPQPLEEKDEQAWGYFLLNSHMRKPSCGFYLRWNGTGIAINPGRRFLDNFHRSGLHITDIDIVIVTQTEPDSYADVQQIYELNYQLNKISSELQIIHYYLNQKAYLELSHVLKPHFKQERNAIHCLELFVDSPEVEKVDLTSDITLHYFPTSTQEALSHHQPMDKGLPQRHTSSPLGIRLDMRLQNNEERRLVKMGYISGTPWSPLLSHHLGHCDLLFTGFGNTNANDFGKLNYNEYCLGYFGTYSLLDEVKPRLLFCCEFDGREGDIRLEVSKKIRQENSSHTEGGSTSYQVVLPADNGLFLDLRALQIRCSVSQALVEPTEVKVVKSGEAFSNLLYLAPTCLLE